MNMYQTDSSLNPIFLQRRPSLFKPTLQDDEILKKSVQKFILLNKQQKIWESNTPIIWERLSAGYRIADLEIDRMNEILELLKTYYFCSDKSYLATNLYIDSHTNKNYQQFILDNVANFNSFCALEEGTGKIIGVVIASISHAFDESMENDNFSPNKDVFNLLKFKYDLMYEANIVENYNIDKYFCILILCVIPDYYGNGIGTSLVRTCLTKAQLIQYPLCIGIFPAGPSYTIAQKFGFKMLSKLLWINIKSSKTSNRHSVLNFNIVEDSFILCMGVLIPFHKNQQ